MRKEQGFRFDEYVMGACYYPEQWDRGLWEQDLERMLDAGISVVRVAEFAWSKVERREGEFDFSFFDGVLDLCEKKGMKVIFGTPTATPPAWLTEKYPEILNANRDGVLYRHGGRRHYNYNSPKYRELCSIIVEKIAEHYGLHNAIIGWQIDNELNCELGDFYSEADSVAFREFLKNKYGTLDALNEAWGTSFWNQEYTEWEQVYVLRPVSNQGNNPHQHLDYIRFISDSARSFCKMQVDIIRKYKKSNDFITTNGRFGHLDNHRMMDESLDIYTYDSYPDFAFELNGEDFREGMNDRKWSLNLTETRSICPHFGIMEQQSGGIGWTTRMEAPQPRPGQLKLWAMQSVAHGADFISFFRWRTARVGTEIHWHGILDYDGRDNRRLAEVKDFYDGLHKINEICGANFRAKLALVKDYDNEWDTEVDAVHRRAYWESEKHIFTEAQKYHIPMDIVYLTDEDNENIPAVGAETLPIEKNARGTSAEVEWSQYPVAIYPHPTIITEKRRGQLKRYVEQGGTLIIGCMAGYKDMNGRCVGEPMPGLFSWLTGTTVEEYTLCSPAEDVVTASMDNESFAMPVYNEVLEIADGQAGSDTCKKADSSENAAAAMQGNIRILARYDNCYYAGKPAITENRIGGGKVIHVGSAFGEENLSGLFDYLGMKEPYDNYISLPSELELVVREKDGRRYFFVLNYKPYPSEITLNMPMKSLLDGKTKNGDVKLPKYGIEIYELCQPSDGL